VLAHGRTLLAENDQTPFNFDPETTIELSEFARKMEQIFLHSPMGSGVFRTRVEIEGMFPGLELVEPGLTRCAEWWPNGPRSSRWILCSTASLERSAASPRPVYVPAAALDVSNGPGHRGRPKSLYLLVWFRHLGPGGPTRLPGDCR
jgi:hypothetical protein